MIIRYSDMNWFEIFRRWELCKTPNCGKLEIYGKETPINAETPIKSRWFLRKWTPRTWPLIIYILYNVKRKHVTELRNINKRTLFTDEKIFRISWEEHGKILSLRCHVSVVCRLRAGSFAIHAMRPNNIPVTSLLYLGQLIGARITAWCDVSRHAIAMTPNTADCQHGKL